MNQSDQEYPTQPFAPATEQGTVRHNGADEAHDLSQIMRCYSCRGPMDGEKLLVRTADALPEKPNGLRVAALYGKLTR